MKIERNKCYNIDCREGFKLMKKQNLQVYSIITSPPYWNLRNYNIVDNPIWDNNPKCKHTFHLNLRKNPMDRGGTGQHASGGIVGKMKDKAERPTKQGFCSKCGAWKGQLGLEPTFELYIKHLCDIFSLAWDVLRDDGTLWVNLGDTYGSDIKFATKRAKCNVPNKCLCLIPQRFAIEMVNRGWILRNVIIWYKPNAMPHSAKDRFTNDFEYIYFFSKKKKYFFNQQFKSQSRNTLSECFNPKGRNKRTIWEINTEPHRESHFAIFPNELVETPIKASTPKYICKKCKKPRKRIIEKGKPLREWQNKCGGKKGEYHGKGIKDYKKANVQNPSDVKRRILKGMKKRIFKGYSKCDCNVDFEPGIVIDPFAGVGTTLVTAFNLGRDYIGFEISEKYYNIIQKNLIPTKNTRLDQFIKKKKKER